MNTGLSLALLALLVAGCRSTPPSAGASGTFQRDLWHEVQLDEETWLQVRVDTDGSAQICLEGKPFASGSGNAKYQLFYSPKDRAIQTFHRLDYDFAVKGVVSGVNVDSTNGHLTSIIFTRVDETNWSVMRSPPGEFLPTKRRTYPADPQAGEKKREIIRHEFLPDPELPK